MNLPSGVRTVFMGSPDFALPTLQALAAALPVVGVVTQPDRPAGRGRVLTPPPIKAAGTIAWHPGDPARAPARASCHGNNCMPGLQS